MKRNDASLKSLPLFTGTPARMQAVGRRVEPEKMQTVERRMEPEPRRESSNSKFKPGVSIVLTGFRVPLTRPRNDDVRLSSPGTQARMQTVGRRVEPEPRRESSNTNPVPQLLPSFPRRRESSNTITLVSNQS